LTVYKAQSTLNGNQVPELSGAEVRSRGKLPLIPGVRLGKGNGRDKKQADNGQKASFHKIAPEK
jgi:hypothetical protein